MKENKINSSFKIILDNMGKRKNNAIEALRFLFMLQICVWHYGDHTWSAGYLGVEFYFILSGFFVYMKFNSNKELGILGFTFSRLKKFYTKYVIAVILCWVILFPWSDNLHTEKFFSSALTLFSDLLMLQAIGVFKGGLNYPLWYFSVLIIGGGGDLQSVTM